MKHIVPILFCLCLAAGDALAAAPEADYLAARDKYIAKIKGLEKANADDAKVRAEHDKARADLEKRLREILDNLAVKGFPTQGKINLESLTDSGVGFGMLDGLVHSQGDNGPQIIVTTQSLLENWLKRKSKEKDKAFWLPSQADAALKLDRFYTQAIGSDAAFTKSADLDVTRREGVDFVSARLGGWAQDIGPYPPSQIIVTLRKGGKFYIASAPTKTEIAKIPACEAIWNETSQKAEKLDGESRSSVEEKGDKDFHACFNERAPKEKFYPALVKQAQDLADRVAGK